METITLSISKERYECFRDSVQERRGEIMLITVLEEAEEMVEVKLDYQSPASLFWLGVDFGMERVRRFVLEIQGAKN